MDEAKKKLQYLILMKGLTCLVMVTAAGPELEAQKVVRVHRKSWHRKVPVSLLCVKAPFLPCAVSRLTLPFPKAKECLNALCSSKW